MKWNDLWQARVGYQLTDAEIYIWKEEIRTEAKGATAGEVLTAVRQVADQKRMGKIQYRPNLGDLIAAIQDGRKAQSHSDEHKVERIMAFREKIKAAMPDKNKTWSIICECEEIDLIEGGEAYARRELGFTRPTMQEMGCKPTQSITSGLIKNVSREFTPEQRKA
jgi:hypothetical protein